MDLCTLEEAFPNIEDGPKWKRKSASPFPGGKDDYSSREERRAARKRAKKVKGPALAYSDSISSPTDPDRPAVERMASVATAKEEKEGFALPVLPKASCLFSDTGVPKYFGNGVDDDVEEGFASFSPAANDDANYRLYPDFVKSGDLKGVEKAASTALPDPPLNDTWKPATSGHSYTSFYDMASALNAPPVEPKAVPEKAKAEDAGSATVKGPTAINDATTGKDSAATQRRLEELMGRLEDLEKRRVQDSQAEILMFVGTGLFLLVSFELFRRH